MLLLVLPILGAQEDDRPASVIVAVVPDAVADASYRTVLRDALLVTLTRNRMKPSASETHDDARATALQENADYLILGTWRNTAETLELTIELWQSDDAAALAIGKASGRISLTMDSIAGAALSQVLPAMKARFPATGETAGTAIAIGPPDAGAQPPEPPVRWRRVELSIGGAPLVTTGTVAEYAKIGAFAVLDLDVRFSVGRSVLAPGLLVSAGWFRALGVGVADILVVPVGPDLHWTIAADANPGVSLHAAAGPAAVVAITSWADTVWKISPFVAGGIIVDIGLTPALGLRVEADYTVVFEGSMVLQAFTPRLALRMRF